MAKSNFVGVDIAGADELRRKIEQLPDAAADAGVEGANEYLINVFKSYPSYTYVSRKTAYPPSGWQSDRQRRYVMAKIADGTISIPYRRTQGLRNDWNALGYGVNQIVVNENPAAVYAYDDQRQAAHMRMAGWKKIGDTLRERAARVVEKFDAGVKKAIVKLKLD